MNSSLPVHVDTLITEATLHDRSGRWSVGIRDRQFVFVGQDYQGTASNSINANGQLLLPGLLEPHAHLDKTYTWTATPPAPLVADASALWQAILHMRAAKALRTPALVTSNLQRALDRAIGFGVTHIRSHIDLGDEADLENVMQLLAVRQQYRDRINLQLTALGSCDTPEQEHILRAALALGLDCVGGAPALCADPRKAVAAAVALAEELRKPLDLHIDETENPDSPCLETLADLVMHRRFPWRVMASHCCSLAFVDAATRARILAKVKTAGIHLVALPACNLVLMGRNDERARPRGSLPVDALLKAGVSVCVGTDNVGDYFQPWGDYDPLRNAALCAEVAQIDEPQRVFPLISSAVAAAFNLRDYGIAPGNRADCSLLATNSLREALSESPLRTHVFFAGKLVLQQQLQQTWN